MKVILFNRLRWSGHLERMEPTRIPRKLLDEKSCGGRKRGRLDDVGGDRKEMGINHREASQQTGASGRRR